MHHREDRPQGQPPGVEAEGDVDADQDQREKERPGGARLELTAYLRAHDRELLQGRRRVDGLERLLHVLAQHFLVHFRRRQADRDVARRAETLHLRIAEARGGELLPHGAEVRGHREGGLRAHSTREVDGEIEAAGEEHHDGGDHEDRRKAIPHVPCGHELEVGLMTEKFHERVLRSGRGRPGV